MARWNIIFFPPSGARHSPVDTLKSIAQSSAQALIMRRLGTIGQLEIGDWPHWVKMVSHIHQLTAGDYRVYFGLVERTIVVCHICRKVGQKAKKSDLGTATANLNNYRDSTR